MQTRIPTVPGAGSFNERVVNLELKTWFGQGGFCALTFEGYKRSTLLYNKLNCDELVDAHHIVCQSYAKKLYMQNPFTLLNGAPILKGVHATANGFPLKRSIHESIHKKAKEAWEVTYVTQELVQKHFEENYGFLCRIPLLPGISLGERWASYLLSKSLIYMPKRTIAKKVYSAHITYQ